MKPNLSNLIRESILEVLTESLTLKKTENKLVVVSDESDKKAQGNETYRNKDRLKAAGFRWDPNLNSWTIDHSQLKNAQEALNKINNRQVEKFFDKLEEIPDFVRSVDNLSKKEELATQIESYIEELSKAVDVAKSSDEIKRFLEFNSRFKGFSLHNTFLIYLQRKDATKVAGFKQWETKFHRRVKKGAKGITILAPVVKKDITKKDAEDSEPESDTPATTDDIKDTKKYISRFIAVTVFDIKDTEAIDSRGEIPTLKWHGSNEPNKVADELYSYVVQVAHDLNVDITGDSASPSGEQGYASGGHINISSGVAGVNRVATLIHEIAHELLHFDKTSKFYIGDSDIEKTSREAKELQAEAVSYVVVRYYGLPAEHHANYLATWRANKDSLRKNLNDIKKAADYIIDKIDSIQKKS